MIYDVHDFDLPPLSETSGLMKNCPEDEIWSKANYNVNTLADNILSKLENNGNVYVDVACIGAAALNQAIKAIAIARQELITKNQDLMAVPYWSIVVPKYDENGEVTRIVLRVIALR